MVLAVSAALALTGCDAVGTDGRQARPTTAPGPGPLVAEDVVRLDLREAPTREEAGLSSSRPDLVLSRVGEALDVELRLPGGTLALRAFGCNIGGGPIGDQDSAYAGRIVVNVRAGATASVLEQLSEQVELLGLDSYE